MERPTPARLVKRLSTACLDGVCEPRDVAGHAHTEEIPHDTAPIIAIALGASLLLSGGTARADVYDYAIDRFEADGNIQGPKDGVADVVEEFDDGVPGPLFGPVAGSSDESGGALHLHSPGVFIAIPGVTPTAFETSAVTSGPAPFLQLGSGDMVLRIALPEQAIAGNDGVNLLLTSVTDAIYYTGISIVNYNSALAERSDPPLTPGVSILSHREEINYATGNEQLVLEHAPIDLAAVTWPLILELRYDDTAETVTAAYSLDGGATFATPFTALPLEADASGATVYLAAVANEGECLAGVAIQKATLSRLEQPRRGGLRMRTTFGGNQRGYEPMRVVITDEGAGGAALLDVNLPDTLIATPQCDPRDGWSGGHGYHYRNYSNALPPDCLPGSAEGLESIDFKWTGTNYVKIKMKNASLPAIVGPIQLAVYEIGGPVNECDGFVGQADCIATPNRAKCSIDY